MGEEVVLGAPPPAHSSCGVESASADPWAATKPLRLEPTVPGTPSAAALCRSRLQPASIAWAAAALPARVTSEHAHVTGSSRRRLATPRPARPPSPAAAACSPSSSAGSRARRAPAATAPGGAGAAGRRPAAASGSDSSAPEARRRVPRRAGAAPRGPCERGSRGRRSRAGSPPTASRRRRSAPRARARRRRRRRRGGSPRSPPSPSRMRGRAPPARSTRSRTSSAEATLRRNEAPATVRRSHLEVRRPRARQRAAAEECAAEVGAAAARAGDDAARRAVEREMVVVEDAGLGEHAERALRALDVELVARRAIEGPRRVGADLRRDAQLGEQRERAPDDGRGREVEVERDRAAAAEMHRARRVEERGDLRQPVAAARRRDRRELRADVVDERAGAHRSHSLEREQTTLQLGPGGAVPSDAVRRDDAVARDDQREAVVGAERPGRSRAPGPAGERGELAVRDDLAPGDRPGRRGELALQRRRPVELERDVVVGRWGRRRGGPRTAGTDPARRRHSA